VDLRNVVKFGSQAFAVTGTVKALRQARAEGDKLKMLDAVVNGVAIATAVALIIREVKQQRDAKNVLKVED
jgi:chorismate synthase